MEANSGLGQWPDEWVQMEHWPEKWIEFDKCPEEMNAEEMR